MKSLHLQSRSQFGASGRQELSSTDKPQTARHPQSSFRQTIYGILGAIIDTDTWSRGQHMPHCAKSSHKFIAKQKPIKKKTPYVIVIWFYWWNWLSWHPRSCRYLFLTWRRGTWRVDEILSHLKMDWCPTYHVAICFLCWSLLHPLSSQTCLGDISFQVCYVTVCDASLNCVSQQVYRLYGNLHLFPRNSFLPDSFLRGHYLRVSMNVLAV